MTVICTVVVLMMIIELQGGVDAWGGLFNRFSPEMLSNLGYGGHGAAYKPSYLQVNIYTFHTQVLFSFYFFYFCFCFLLCFHVTILFIKLFCKLCIRNRLFVILIQRPLAANYANNFGEGLEVSNAVEPCSEKRCIANEHCCQGQVCIDVEGGLSFFY